MDGIVWVHIRAVTVGLEIIGPRGEVIGVEGDTEPLYTRCRPYSRPVKLCSHQQQLTEETTVTDTRKDEAISSSKDIVFGVLKE